MFRECVNMCAHQKESDASDGAEEDGEGHVVGFERPSLLEDLRNILAEYPDDGQIFKEMIQNAEDAGATTIQIFSVAAKASQQRVQVCVLIMTKSLPDEDWSGIRKLHTSVKAKDPLKVGRFGLGFKSVFHVTDHPVIISGHKLMFMDPFKDEKNAIYEMHLKSLTTEEHQALNCILTGVLHVLPEQCLTRSGHGKSHTNPTLDFSVSLTDDCLQAVREERKRFIAGITTKNKQCPNKQVSEASFLNVEMRVKEDGENHVTRDQWMVVNFHHGLDDMSPELRTLCKYLQDKSLTEYDHLPLLPCVNGDQLELRPLQGNYILGEITLPHTFLAQPCPEDIIAHLQMVISKFSKTETRQFSAILYRIYTQLTSEDMDVHGQLSNMRCILNERAGTFHRPSEFWTREAADDLDLKPHRFLLPSSLSDEDLEDFFLLCGCRQRQDSAMLNDVLHEIQQKYQESSCSKEDYRKDFKLVVKILDTLKKNADVEDGEVLLPVYTTQKNTLILRPARECTVAPDPQTIELLSEEEGLVFVHPDLHKHKDVALALGAIDLRSRTLTGVDNIDLEDEEYGQREALTTRLRNLLQEGYTDGFCVPKVGRFGLGFNAVYNLTEVPTVYSGTTMAMLDPHETYLEGKRGKKMNFNHLMNKVLLKRMPNQFRPFQGIFGCDILNSDYEPFQGTLFRFPLRTEAQAAKSEICKEAFSKHKQDEFVQSLMSKAGNLMLFLQNVQRLELYRLTKDCKEFSQATRLLVVERKQFYAMLVAEDYKVFPHEDGWASFSSAWFFDPEFNETDVGRVAFGVLQKFWSETKWKASGVLVDVPHSVVKNIRNAGQRDALQQREITEVEFFTEVLFPRLSGDEESALDVHDRNLLVLHALMSHNEQLQDLVKCHSCIPCQPDGVLKLPSQLVHPKGAAAPLFTVDDGRFPQKADGADFCHPDVLTELVNMGMVKDKLPNKEVMERAQSVEKIANTNMRTAVQRAVALVKYLSPDNLGQDLQSVTQSLSEVKFLPVLPKPTNWPFPWHGDGEKFVAPCEAFGSSLKELVACQAYILDDVFKDLQQHGSTLQSLGVTVYTARGSTKFVQTVMDQLITISRFDVKNALGALERIRQDKGSSQLAEEDVDLVVNVASLLSNVLQTDSKEKLDDSQLQNAHLPDSDSWLRPDDYTEDFGQHEELTNRINRLLENYTRDEAIFKELLQNADDAGATEKDMEGIQDLGQGSKGDEVLKTGKYGVGFNAVYNLTDAPCFWTRVDGEKETICVLDPNFFVVKRKKRPGIRMKIDDRFHSLYPDMLKPFIVNEQGSTNEQSGTVFRLPLRTHERAYNEEVNRHTEGAKATRAVRSQIEQDAMDPEDLERLLREFQPKMSECLLFLNNVKKVGVYSIQQDGALHREYETQLTTEKRSATLRKDFNEHVKDEAGKLKTEGQGHSLTKFQPREVAVHTELSDTLGKKEEWLVVSKFGMTETDASFETQAQSRDIHKHRLLPLAGVALCMSGTGDSAPAAQGKRGKRKHAGKTDSTSANQEKTEFQAYCVLPLPVDTGLPVHVNARFALDHETRRNIQTERNTLLAEWNRLLARRLIVPAYIKALHEVKATLFSEEQKSWTPQRQDEQGDNLRGRTEATGPGKKRRNVSPALRSRKKAKIATVGDHGDYSSLERKLSIFNSFFPDVSDNVDAFWRSLVQELYKQLAQNEADVFPVERKDLQRLLFVPAVRSQGFPGFFSDDSKKVKNSLKNILLRLNMNIIESPCRIYIAFLHSKVDGVRCVDEQAVIQFLSSCQQEASEPDSSCNLKDLPKPVEDTSFETAKNVKEVFEFISGEVSSLDGLPLSLRVSGKLYLFGSSTPTIVSYFADLLPGSSERNGSYHWTY
nr:hypothetical protein BaRGS_015381 [Batillaria attramentaria]